MNAKVTAHEVVRLVKEYRNGEQESSNMPRWVAELEIGCIPLEQPEVARARIEPVRIDQHAPYPIKQVATKRKLMLAFELAWYMPSRLVA